MKLESVSTGDLLAEIVRRTNPAPECPRVIRTRKPKQKRIKAGEALETDALVVVDEDTMTAYAYPKTDTIPDKRRIWGYTLQATAAGERVRLRHWCFDDMTLG